MFRSRLLAPPRQYFGVKFGTQLLGIQASDLRKRVRDEIQMTRAWSDALGRLTTPSHRQASNA